jgi:YesN/AraC family two-component response regulator
MAKKKSVDLVKLSEETKKLTAMIVEDEKEANRLLSATFSNFFSDVYSTFNGKDGLEIYKKYQPDIVFVDIIMPEMDGITLSRKIRELNKNQIIVIISASNDITKISETIEIGVNSFIQKPIDTDKIIELLTAITDIVRKRQKIETKTFSISLPLDVYDVVDSAAKSESISKNAIVIRALRDFFKMNIDNGNL